MTRAIPKHAMPVPEESEAAVAAAKEAATDCAFVIMGFFRISPENLIKSTRGAAHESFPRQILMAGLTDGLGFSSLTTGRAIGRDKATVEHARRVVEAFRIDASLSRLDADDIVDMLGMDGVQEWLGGIDKVGEFLKHADVLVEDFFRAFQLVAINGPAYRKYLDERRREIAEARARE